MTTVTFTELAYGVRNPDGSTEFNRFTPPAHETHHDPVSDLECVYGPRIKGSLKTRRTPSGRERFCHFALEDGYGRKIDTFAHWTERIA